jgi:DNA-binding CsgD family transcriptional regulator
VDRDRILELKAEGHSLRQIATTLGVGYGTVRARLLTSHKLQPQKHEEPCIGTIG